MSRQRDIGSHELAITRVFPQWFKDMDSAIKPMFSSVVLLVLAAPMVAFTIIEWNKAAGLHKQITALLAGGGSRAQLVSLTDQFQAADHRAQLGIMVTAVVCWFGAMFIAFSLSSLSAAWLVDMTVRVRRAAAGDLTTEIHRDNASQLGDIQEALGKMIASFHATVVRIDQSAAELRDSAAEMSGISGEAGGAVGDVARSVSSISAGAGNQVELIGDTSQEVGEIEQAILEAAAHAEQASQAGAEAVQLTDEGVERAAEIEQAMENVRQTALATTNSIRSLDEKSTRIDLIVRSIAAIAEQTNLLALNAAIEAARAGEQGRGFAVVAEEVRRLAEDAQHSTGEIAELTESIRHQTADAVAAVDNGAETFERGSEAVSLNRHAFAEIREAVAQLNDSTVRITTIARNISDEASRVRMEIEDVASVAEQSSASTEQVSAATQQSAASAQEVTASAESVSDTATALAGFAAQFSLRTASGNKVVPLTAATTPATVTESEEKVA